jgi:hypothetical protein
MPLEGKRINSTAMHKLTNDRHNNNNNNDGNRFYTQTKDNIEEKRSIATLLSYWNGQCEGLVKGGSMYEQRYHILPTFFLNLFVTIYTLSIQFQIKQQTPLGKF